MAAIHVDLTVAMPSKMIVAWLVCVCVCAGCVVVQCIAIMETDCLFLALLAVRVRCERVMTLRVGVALHNKHQKTMVP